MNAAPTSASTRWLTKVLTTTGTIRSTYNAGTTG